MLKYFLSRINVNSADTLQRFIFEQAEIRGEIVRLEKTYQTIISQRDYPLAVQKILGEALVSCLLLVGSIKFAGEISLQFQGDKALPIMIIQCDHLLNIRAFARYKSGLKDADYQQAFIRGNMTLSINQADKNEIYQSHVPISSPNMSENLMNFFARSEQIATQIHIVSDNERVVGMLLQLLPSQESEQRELFWEYATAIGQTITSSELLNLDNETMLSRLYHEVDIQLLSQQQVDFNCRCNNEKMIAVIKMLGHEEINSILEEKGQIEITCDFCNKHYYFDAIDVNMIFRTIH